MELWKKKLWYYGQNYCTMEKIYGTIPRTTKIRFTMVKNMGFFTQSNGKTMVIYQNI